jgi:hypothetical protein
MSRNRIIYQSKALFIGPNSTGMQTWPSGAPLPANYLTTGTGFTGVTATGYAALADAAKSFARTGDSTSLSGTQVVNGTGLLYKLDRVQNCNFNFTINRQDINEFGKLARIATIANEPPTVTLDFSYYLTDGLNERLMGFNFGGSEIGKAGAPDWDNQMAFGASALSGFLRETQGQNYYILTVDEGEDVVGSTVGANDSVVAIGNGFLTEYAFTASVGEVPTANVTIEGFNIKSDVGQNGAFGYTGSNPAIDTSASPASRITSINKYYKINSAQIGTGAGTGAATISALRPGDIVLSSVSTDKTAEDPMVQVTNFGDDSVRVQSFGFTIPLTRTVLSRLGTLFGYNRVVQVPLNMDVTINALVNELVSKDMFDVLCGDQPKKDFTITLKKCAETTDTSVQSKLAFTFRGAILTSENHSTDIGGNETVDLTYSIQVGGANDSENGVFMSGSYNTGNAALNVAYPYLGLSGLLTNFYGIGTARNY